eukprot:11772073-Heterocapsa_arctica.AAC.1
MEALCAAPPGDPLKQVADALLGASPWQLVRWEAAAVQVADASCVRVDGWVLRVSKELSLIHISEPTRR